MKTITLLFSFWCLSSFAQITVLNDTTVLGNKTNKFVFERLNKSSTKTISGGKGVLIKLTIGDTIVSTYGWLVDANNESIFINPIWKVNSLQKENYNFTESFNYNNSLMIINLDSIKSIQYDYNFNFFFDIMGALSLTTTLIASPIIAIDKNSPNNFNVNRYKTITFSSLASSVFFITLSFIINNRENAYLLKPKLIEKINK